MQFWPAEPLEIKKLWGIGGARPLGLDADSPLAYGVNPLLMPKPMIPYRLLG